MKLGVINKVKNSTKNNNESALTCDERIMKELMGSSEISDITRTNVIDIVRRYQHLIDVRLPSFTDHETWLVRNYLNGLIIDPMAVEFGLEQDIEEFDDLSEELVKYPELEKKIQKLSLNQRYALINRLEC